MTWRFRESNAIVWMIVLVLGVIPLATVVGLARQQTEAPRFDDPARARELATAFPEIERAFNAWFERAHVPGAAMGIIIDGELAWVKTAGVADVTSKRAVTPDTVFRIASMTKSFTAMAILALRDDGKLSLDDPVEKHVPEIAGLKYPTSDSPVITIRHLLTHTEGFPEDNPWGDRQLAQPRETLSAWMRGGIPFSTPPGTEFEYSNYGYAILGQIVERVSKQPYDRYVTEKILQPLGMTASTFEKSAIPTDRIALGYGRENDAWKEEPMLAHGTFGAMGGLWTSTRDLARYVGFHLAAWPPRDGPETGPVRRASVREMAQAARPVRARVTRPSPGAAIELAASAYGYGLETTQSCRFARMVSHGGGLPGYGSVMLWLPDYGIGFIGMDNLTYGGWRGLIREALEAFAKTGALAARPAEPSPALLQAKRDVSSLVTRWDDALAERIAADNLFLDESAGGRSARLRELAERHGTCSAAEDIDAENALRGTWRMNCVRGWLKVGVTLAPTVPPRVQSMFVRGVMPPSGTMKKAIDEVRPRITSEASEWGSCRVGEIIAGDGERTTVLDVQCDRGGLAARLTIDPMTSRVESLTYAPGAGNVCSP